MAESSDTITQLFDKLDTKHPDYEEQNSSWDLYRDILGEVPVKKTKYLQKAELEDPKNFALRVSLAQWIPESPLAIDKIISALYKDKPKRELKSPMLDKFLDDVDREGTHMNTYIQRIAEQVLGYGTTRILINVVPLKVQKGKQPTRADELRANSRPYLILYNPLSIIDWAVDAVGRLSMIRIKEVRSEPTATGEPHQKVTRFIQYTTTDVSWWDFAGSEEKRVLLDKKEKKPHGLGCVPVVVKYWKKIKDMIGKSYIQSASKADVKKFMAESDLAFDTYLHAHPVMKAKVRDELQSIGIGSSSYLKLDPDSNEDIEYVDPPTPAFQALQFVINEARATIHRHAGTDPLGVYDSAQTMFQASGVSRAWSFGMSEARILTHLADIMEEIERSIYEIVLRYYERKSSDPNILLFKGDVTYPDEFDLSATQTLIDEAQQISATINSPSLLRVLHKRIAASKVGDTTATVLKQINKEIDTRPLINTPIEKPQTEQNTENVADPPDDDDEDDDGPTPPNPVRRTN